MAAGFVCPGPTNWSCAAPNIKDSDGETSLDLLRRARRPRQQVDLCRMVSSEMSRRVALVRTDVSEELSGSFIRVTRIGELGTTLAVTSNRRKL
jgi:hypothetical protein